MFRLAVIAAEATAIAIRREGNGKANFLNTCFLHIHERQHDACRGTSGVDRARLWRKVGSIGAGGEVPEHVRLDLMEPGDGSGFLAPKGTSKWNKLFADQNSKEANERDDGWRRRTDIQEAVNDADQQASPERQDIYFHGHDLHHGQEVAPFLDGAAFPMLFSGFQMR
ncbi:hypothetical protein J2854_004678 [Agrobacterium tumefaciens]|nr:hypothetical protein [Agrobacterium tumefaciens]